MGQASNINEPKNSSKPTNRLTALAFFEIGIFEVGFVITLLLIIFGTLNYFNILYVSETFPKYLGWLPSQRARDIYRNKTNNQVYNDFLKQYYASRREVPTGTSRPTPTPTPIPEYIKNDVKSLIRDILISSLIPNNLVVEKQNVENPNNFTFYGTGWETANKDIISLSVEYNQEKNIIDRQILIHIPRISSNLDTSSSSSLVRDYIKINPSPPFSCISLPTITKSTFCETFWEDAQGIKRGINITSPVYGLQETQLLYCEHHKGSTAYSWKSCNTNFAEKGIEEK